MELLVGIILGAIAGWLASKIMKASSNGLLLNIILGIVGSFVGVKLFEFLGLSNSTSSHWLGSLIIATIGAIILIFSARFLFKKK